MPRILVIDDDPAISELVAVNLEMAGYDVSQAEDGIKGQALALQLQPDLIMLDLMLPRVDGFTVWGLPRNKMTNYNNDNHSKGGRRSSRRLLLLPPYS